MLPEDKPRKLRPFWHHVGYDVTPVDKSFAQAIADLLKKPRVAWLFLQMCSTLFGVFKCLLKTIYTCSCPFCSFIRCGSLWSPLCLLGHCKARPRGRSVLVGILPTIASVCVCMRVSIFFAYYSRSSCNLFNHLFMLSVNSRCRSLPLLVKARRCLSLSLCASCSLSGMDPLESYAG